MAFLYTSLLIRLSSYDQYAQTRTKLTKDEFNRNDQHHL